MANITITYPMTYINGTDNALWGVILEISHATNHFFFPGLLITLFIILTWAFINRTQDIGKSFATSSFITSILTLIIYYAGKTEGINVVPDIFLLTCLVVTALTVAGIYFSRSKM